MKLFCSTKLQQKLGCRCERAPVPADPLDAWYANVVQLNGRDTLVAILPDLKFCAVAWDIRKDQWANLNQIAVQAIRHTLKNPLYSIPKAAVEAYMPADSDLELCSTGDRGFVSKMGAITTKILENEYVWYEEGFDPGNTEFAVNHGFVHLPNGRTVNRYEAVRILLQQRCPEAVPSLELEVSLDLPQHTARRTLIVPGETPLCIVTEYLQLAFGWERNCPSTLHLPARPGNAGTAPSFSDEEDSGPEDFSPLADFVRVGDTFRYLYGAESRWELVIRTSRSAPNPPAELPLCTLSEGAAPAEYGDQASMPDTAENITRQLRELLCMHHPSYSPPGPNPRPGCSRSRGAISTSGQYSGAASRGILGWSPGPRPICETYKEGTMITIRKTAEEDAAVLLEIQRAAFLPIYEIYHDAGNPALRGIEDITRRLHSPFRQYTILEDGEIVGGIFYVTEGSTPHVPCLGPGECYLGRLYIRPDRQSQGIGRQAILLCEREFPDARKFTVDFPRELDKNRRCYEAAGFRPTGRTLTPEPGLTLLLYEKQLCAPETQIHP